MSSQAWACYATPDEQIVHHDELIERTNNIVYALATSSELKKNEHNIFRVYYEFDVIEVIKGKSDSKFVFETGVYSTTSSSQMHFNWHKQEEFWLNRGGAQSHFMSCTIVPGFEIGYKYLMFLDKPYHKKSFEIVGGVNLDWEEKDKWLQYVREKVKEQASELSNE